MATHKNKNKLKNSEAWQIYDISDTKSFDSVISQLQRGKEPSDGWWMDGQYESVQCSF